MTTFIEYTNSVSNIQSIVAAPKFFPMKAHHLKEVYSTLIYKGTVDSDSKAFRPRVSTLRSRLRSRVVGLHM